MWYKWVLYGFLLGDFKSYCVVFDIVIGICCDVQLVMISEYQEVKKGGMIYVCEDDVEYLW